MYRNPHALQLAALFGAPNAYFEATAEICKREKLSGQHTPIIALTAHAMKEDRDRCLTAGMDAYVTKPIRPDELFHTIHELLAPANL